MEDLGGKVLFSAFLLSAAWQDARRKSVSIWVYIIFGAAAWIRILSGLDGILAGAAGMAPGLILLAAGKLTGGAAASGDGWFFVIGGVILGIWDSFLLLLYGVVLCGLYCLAFYLTGLWQGKNRGKETVPFLPFLVPVWIWMVVS